MSEIIERAARALVIELARQAGDDLTPSDVHFEEGLTLQYIDQNTVDVGGLVRAVLQAIREPSEAMVDRFVSRALCVSVHGDGGWSNYAREQWRAMIDAALAQHFPSSP